MRSRPRLSGPWKATSAAAVLAFLSFSGTARATTCTANADCGHGYTCEITSVGGCPPCPPNADCICAPAMIKTCELATCRADADCAAGDVCQTPTYGAVACASPAMPACPANVDCGAPAPVATPCTVTTPASVCTHKYNLPCTIASDCGTSFNCVADMSQTCSAASEGVAVTGGMTTGVVSAVDGGAGFAIGVGAPLNLALPEDAGPPVPVNEGMTSAGSIDAAPIGSPVDGGIVVSPPAPVCTTTTLPTSHCEPMFIPCSSDASCPATWTCSIGTSVGGATAGGGSATTGAASSTTASSPPSGAASPPCAAVDAGNGQTSKVCDNVGGGFVVPPDAATPPGYDPLPATGQCVPPGYAIALNSPQGATGALSSSPQTGGRNANGASGDTSVVPAPAFGAGSNGAGAASGTSSGSSSSGPNSTPGDTTSAAGDLGHGDGGCQAGGASGRAPDAGLLGMLVWMGFALRKRRNRTA